ncbi:hypothetical protein GSI_08060 [Ganoderma sinense ZZ0214-1]|uniref:Uncharacterized protein n=1 Tax=Ganoderma sinense ZZ0214-1 TaxID=1077348 RepID=A0A2G8S7V2_9APHY|nr:hypothetical protein GSI_08060 [Ganoderma sinense ZZ0214-1]
MPSPRLPMLLTLLQICCAASARITVNSTPSLSFDVLSGGNNNYFLRDNLTSAQLLLSSPNNTNKARRLVVALPAGNSGALVYFLPSTSNPLGVTLVDGSFKSATADYFNAGIQADLAFDGNATLGVAVIGAVRAMRDYVEGRTIHSVFNYTLGEYNDTSVRLHRQWINTTSPTSSLYKGADVYLTVPAESSARLVVTPAKNDTRNPPAVDIVVPSAADAEASARTLRVTVVTNETSLTGLDTQALFLPENERDGTRALETALQGLADGTNVAAQQVSFLTYVDKFTAGGWRFLTYFGRDSLIALRLLMPTLTSEAIESALGAVIERANSTGAFCHEETIGDYASLVNMGNGHPELGNQPYYDYKACSTFNVLFHVDLTSLLDDRHCVTLTQVSDLLLLPALSHYFLELPQGKKRTARFFKKTALLQNGTYAEILNRTIHYNLQRAIPFSQSPKASNLIGLRPGQSAGNWRDSNQGLGHGFYPFDVNTALVPASLRATQHLLEAGVLDFARLNASEVAAVASVWEAQAPALFDVTVNSTNAEARLKNFVSVAGLSTALLNSTSNTTTANVSFYALSLKKDGTPVEVLNSDLSFNLVYGANVSRVFLQHVVDALQPYPRGLLTNIGMVVANPAYDSDTSLIGVLNRAAYHGTVVWSFQQGLMASGLARQLGFCSQDNVTTVDTNTPPSQTPEWCSDTAFVQSLRDAQTRLWTSIRGAEDEIYSEVWSYSFDNATNTFSVADLASFSGTESDAIQLWSYGFLGLLDPSSDDCADRG